MTRSVALLLSIVLMLAVTAPAADAHKRGRKHSNVPACAAVVGAPARAALDNWRPDVVRLVLLKEMNATWH